MVNFTNIANASLRAAAVSNVAAAQSIYDAQIAQQNSSLLEDQRALLNEIQRR